MADLKELREKQAKLVADARAKLDEIKDDTPEARAKEVEAEYDRIMAEHDRLEERAERLARMAAAEAELNKGDPDRRPNEDRSDRREPEDADKLAERRQRAFSAYLRGGMDGMVAEQRQILREMRAQSVGTDSAGGYLVPPGFLAELIVSLKAWGPMLDGGIVRELVTASGNQIEIPTLDDTSSQAYRLAENTATTNEGDLAFGQKVLDAYKYASGPILVSSELLQDSAFDIEAEVRNAMAMRFGRKINADLTTGDGSGDPNGVVTASGAGVTAAGASAITFDDVIGLLHSVDPAYRSDPSCRFMFHDNILLALRKLKDSNGAYIWQPADVRTGAPGTILGYAYSINQAMASSIATTAKTMLFGAFNRYVVRRVAEVAVRRLNERYAEVDQVGFVGFARYDGELLDAGAVKRLTQA